MGISDAQLTLGIIIVVASVLMLRLDRLGKQLEAVSAMIRADLARTEEQRSEILQEWKETKKQADLVHLPLAFPRHSGAAV